MVKQVTSGHTNTLAVYNKTVKGLIFATVGNFTVRKKKKGRKGHSCLCMLSFLCHTTLSDWWSESKQAEKVIRQLVNGKSPTEEMGTPFQISEKAETIVKCWKAN